MPYHSIGNFGGPAPSFFLHTMSRCEEEPINRGANLVNFFQSLQKMVAAGKFKHHHRSVGGNENVSRRISQSPDLHIAAISAVADVDRIEEHRSGIIQRSQLPADPIDSITPQA
jgi:hypothetical protein